MEITKANVLNAYRMADDNGKMMLQTLFPDINMTDNEQIPITERIQCFEDACAWCESHGCEELVKTYENANEWVEVCEKDVFAYLELRIICAALNEGREPQFKDDETRWYPYFYLYTQEEIDKMDDEQKKQLWLFGGCSTNGLSRGLAAAYSSYAWSYSCAAVSSRLALKSEELARYCGKQFINIWADYVISSNVNNKAEQK